MDRVDRDEEWGRGDAPALKLSRKRTLGGRDPCPLAERPRALRTSMDACSHIELERHCGPSALRFGVGGKDVGDQPQSTRSGSWMSRSAYRYEHDLASLLQLPLQELLHARDVVFERRRWRLCREVLVRRKGFTCGGLAIGLGGCGHGWYKRGGKGYLEGALAAQNSPQSGFGGDPGLRGSMGGDE